MSMADHGYRGIRLTDLCQEAYHYSDYRDWRTYEDTHVFSLLIARAALGVTCNAYSMHEKKCNTEIESWKTQYKDYSEFYIKDPEQIYVEYDVLYTRNFSYGLFIMTGEILFNFVLLVIFGVIMSFFFSNDD